MKSNRKRIPLKNKKMPTTISPVIEAASVDVKENGDQIVTLQLRYTGQQDLSQQFTVDDELNIEIPSHAPPPTP